jgi:hypothetical protein
MIEFWPFGLYSATVTGKQMNQVQADEYPNFIVHSFTSTYGLPSSPTTILDAGLNAIGSACRPNGWFSVGWDFDSSVYCGYLVHLSVSPPVDRL